MFVLFADFLKAMSRPPRRVHALACAGWEAARCSEEGILGETAFPVRLEGLQGALGGPFNRAGRL